ncbi:hypothetical protein [Yoonia vestfoldensis]|nr:hypothetical protein [Yoonia vestfoldensis]
MYIDEKRINDMPLKKYLIGFVSLVLLGGTLPSGAISAMELTIIFDNSAGQIIMTDDQLQAMEQVEIITDTPWTKTPMTYEGPTLWSVLEQAGAIGREFEMIALNDYSIRLAADRITPDWPIVARLQNGKTMSVRDKGPYWVMFPFDQNKDLQTETFFALSIWQLAKIRVID